MKCARWCSSTQISMSAGSAVRHLGRLAAIARITESRNSVRLNRLSSTTRVTARKVIAALSGRLKRARVDRACSKPARVIVSAATRADGPARDSPIRANTSSESRISSRLNCAPRRCRKTTISALPSKLTSCSGSRAGFSAISASSSFPSPGTVVAKKPPVLGWPGGPGRPCARSPFIRANVPAPGLATCPAAVTPAEPGDEDETAWPALLAKRLAADGASAGLGCAGSAVAPHADAPTGLVRGRGARRLATGADGRIRQMEFSEVIRRRRMVRHYSGRPRAMGPARLIPGMLVAVGVLRRSARLRCAGGRQWQTGSQGG